jgi:hypothetical protein
MRSVVHRDMKETLVYSKDDLGPDWKKPAKTVEVPACVVEEFYL